MLVKTLLNSHVRAWQDQKGNLCALDMLKSDMNGNVFLFDEVLLMLGPKCSDTMTC